MILLNSLIFQKFQYYVVEYENAKKQERQIRITLNAAKVKNIIYDPALKIRGIDYDCLSNLENKNCNLSRTLLNLSSTVQLSLRSVRLRLQIFQ